MTVSIGKIRGMQQLSNEKGVFTIVACDQRGALGRMMEAVGRTPVTHEAMVQMKQDIVGPLAPAGSGVLLDPEFAAAQLVYTGTMPGSTGLVVALEQTGYEDREGDRLTHLLPDWSVAKIKAMGAAAVKLLIYFNPRREAAAQHQLDVVKLVAEQCKQYDIPFMLEPLAYATVDGDEEGFIKEKPDLVVETAELLSEYDVDLLKMEFPVHASVDDKDEWQKQCERLNAASRPPWALLSAGVRFEQFADQLRTACEAGASGFVCGRALWREAVEIVDEAERKTFLRTTMPTRMDTLVDIASTHGSAWSERPSHKHGLEDAPEGWYASYKGFDV